jgi:hypothetical protein
MIAILCFIGIIALWYNGGQPRNKWMRLVVLPFVAALPIALAHCWTAAVSVASARICGLGYGNYEPGEKNCLISNILEFFGIKDHSGEIIRAIWGFVVGLVMYAPRGVMMHRYWQWILYIGTNTVICYCVSKFKLNQKRTDFLVGIGVGSIIFL